MLDLSKNIEFVTRQIRDCETQCGRAANSVDLVLVSKAQSIEKIQAAYDAGQRKFGENYLQEALVKIQALGKYKMDPRLRGKDGAAIEWHFIGRIQSNKTQQIAEHFAWVQSVASLKIVYALNAARPSHLPPLNICLQVNISQEASKAGIQEEELFDLVCAIQPLKQLKLRGLMCVPENAVDFASQFTLFKRVADLQHALIKQGFELDTLSMGMSHDFLAAIKAGSTMVRIGTAVFGPR